MARRLVPRIADRRLRPPARSVARAARGPLGLAVVLPGVQPRQRRPRPRAPICSKDSDDDDRLRLPHGAARDGRRRLPQRWATPWSTSWPTRWRRCRRRPVTPDEPPAAVRAALGLGGPLPGSGHGARQRCSTRSCRRCSTTRCSTPIRASSATSPRRRRRSACSATSSPRRSTRTSAAGACRRRRPRSRPQTVRWIATLIGYPADCGGLLVSGGNMANFVGFFAARAARAPVGRARARVAGERPRAASPTPRPRRTPGSRRPPTCRASAPTPIRWIPTDAEPADGRRRARPADRPRTWPPATCRSWSSAPPARSARAPSIRCRTSRRSAARAACGSTSTAPTAALPRPRPRRPDDLRALALADSVAVDPHKWLYAPLEAGCALVRDPQRCAHAFAYHPPYYHFDERGAELRRLRPAELARLPRAEGLAGAAAGRRRRLPRR